MCLASSFCKKWFLFERRRWPNVHPCVCCNQTPEKQKKTVTSSRKHGKIYFSFLSDLRFQTAYQRILFQLLSKEFLVWTNVLIRQLLIFVCLCFSLQIRHTFSAASKSWLRRWRQPMSKKILEFGSWIAKKISSALEKSCLLTQVTASSQWRRVSTKDMLAG